MKIIKKCETPFQKDFHDLEKIDKPKDMSANDFFFTEVLLIHLIQSSFLNTQLMRWLFPLNYVYIYFNTGLVINNISQR